jgi:hypothetical protein
MSRIVIYVLLAALSLWALHRLGLWLERRGWLFYRDRKPSSSAVGSAFLNIESFVRPTARHEIEAHQEQVVRDDESGDPPDPGPRRRPDFG